MDLGQFTAFLPAILAVFVPMVVSVIKKTMSPMVGKLPKWSIPLIAALVGAIGEILITGNTTPVMGAAVGAGGTGVRDVVKNLGSSS